MVQKLNKLVLEGILGVLMFVCLSFIIDSKAEAIIDVRVGYGFGNLNLDGSKEASESGFNAELLFQPIIVIPVSIGASYLYHNMKYSADDVKNRNYERIGLDVEAWIPLIPLITPFAGATFIPWHEFSIKDETVDGLDMGYGLKAGIKVNIIPLLNAFIEGQYSAFKSDSKDYSSWVGVLGVELDL